MRKMMTFLWNLIRNRSIVRDDEVVKVGESYKVPDGRKGHEGESNWIHGHH